MSETSMDERVAADGKDQPDPRDAVVEAARETMAYFNREYPRTMVACDTQGKWKALSSALAALDAEGGQG